MPVNIPSIQNAQEFDFHYEDDFWLSVAETICRRHKIIYKFLRRSAASENIVFLIDDAFLLKIHTPFRNGFAREIRGLEFSQGRTNLILPELISTGVFEGYDYLITTQLSGDLMTREVWLNLDKKEQIKIASQLANGLKELHSHTPPPNEFDWQKFIEHQAETCLASHSAGGATTEWLSGLPEYLETNLKFLPRDCKKVFLHGDVHFGNLRLEKKNGRWQISGLFDFADSLNGFHEYEFVAVGVLMFQGQGELQREFFRAYGYRESEINENLRARLMVLTILYECSNLRKYALRLKSEAVDFTLGELERGIWAFAE